MWLTLLQIGEIFLAGNELNSNLCIGSRSAGCKICARLDSDCWASWSNVIWKFPWKRSCHREFMCSRGWHILFRSHLDFVVKHFHYWVSWCSKFVGLFKAVSPRGEALMYACLLCNLVVQQTSMRGGCIENVHVCCISEQACLNPLHRVEHNYRATLS